MPDPERRGGGIPGCVGNPITEVLGDPARLVLADDMAL
jgi:hypothetical protein